MFIDQRGTGGSNPLPCELWGNGGTELAALFPLDRVRACRAQLEPKADLRLYTTALAVDDFAEVVAALGYACRAAPRRLCRRPSPAARG